MRIAVVAAATCLSLVGLSGAQDVEAAIKRLTNIPAQPLTSALQLLAKAHGFQIVYRSDLVSDIRTPGATGELTTDEALTRLLSGTALAFKYLDDRTITIIRQPSARPPGANQRTTRAQAGAPAQDSGATAAGSDTPSRRNGDGSSHSFWDRFRLAQAGEATTAGNGSVERSGNTADSKPAMEEIIVTATKRNERIQDVPMSIGVVTAEDIDRRGLVNAADYLRGIPGANFVDGPYGQSIIIRGLETSPHLQNNFSGATTGTYFGETPTTSAAGLLSSTNVDIKLVDIERVEVLRGPQGTAFGSSSLGGTVRTIPRAPRLDGFDAKLAGGYSVTSGSGNDNYDIQAVANIPLIADRLAVRAVGYRYDDSGYYSNRAGSDAAFRTNVVTRYGAGAFAADDEHAGSYYSIGGRLAALFQANEDLQLRLSYLSQKTETDGFALSNSGTYTQTLLQVDPQHVIRGEESGVSDTDIDIANATVEYGFGWGNLLATYSRIDSGSIQAYPFGAAALDWAMSSTADSDHRENVGELRLATTFEGAWNFLAGLYIEDLKDRSLGDNRWHGALSTIGLAIPTAAGLGPALGTNLTQSRVKQQAAFGEVSWEILQGLTLRGGVRAYEYDRSLKADGVGFFYGPNGTQVDRDTEASGENFLANLSYKPADDALVYAGWSQGFRLGKPQTGLIPGVCDINPADGLVDNTNITIASTQRTDSDSVDNYEIGGKFALLDRRVIVDAAVFRMEWSGVPVQIRPGVAPCVAGYVANAGEALSEGVELQASFQIAEPFRIDLGGSWVDARLTDPVDTLRAPAGRELPGAPSQNGNLGLQYDFNIAGHKAYVRADTIYVGSFYGSLQGDVNSQPLPNLKVDDYVKVDATARMMMGNLNIDLYARNLTDEDAFSFRSTFANAPPFFGYRLRPRTIGLRLGYTF